MVNYEDFCENCKALIQRVEDATSKCSRNLNDVKILPVTKTHPLDAAEFSAKFGFSAVGENKVQEASIKIEQAHSIKAKSSNIDWSSSNQ